MSFEFDKYTHLYTKTLQDIQGGVPLIVHQGGTSSSKTYSTCQVLLSLAMSEPEQVITVAGQDIPNLKKGPIRDTKNIITSEKRLHGKFTYNKSERIYTFTNGSIVEYNSYDDEQDAKSGRRDYLFVNEANGIPFDIYDALKLRTKKAVIIDFNPNAPFWAHEKILPNKKGRKWYVSTFRNNPFIDEKIKRDILSYEPTPENIAAGTANKYKWQVYGLGQVGRLEGLVFPDFIVSTEWPEQYKWRVWGLDFGFTNDPTSLVEVRYAHGNLYAKQHIYSTGLTNPDISERLKKMEFPKNERIIADSAEPKSIEELYRAGWRVVGAEKGRDSINQGIDAIKRYNLYIQASSKDLVDEFNSYTWDKDRDGNPTNKPVDKFNHGIDAIRYALQKKLIGKEKTAGVF